MRTTLRFLVAALLCVGIAGATAFQNGSLSCAGIPDSNPQTTCGFTVPAGPYWLYQPAASTNILGWTVGTSGGVNWSYEYDPANGKGWNTRTSADTPGNNGDGLHYSVGLQGTNPSGVWEAGTIKQTFDTVTGTTYRMDFKYSMAPAAFDAGKAFVQASIRAEGIAADVITYTAAGSAHGTYVGKSNLAWQDGFYQWTADASGTTTISFQSLEVGDALGKSLVGGVLIDGVTFREAGIPEPGTMSLMFGAGLFGLAWLVRRKR